MEERQGERNKEKEGKREGMGKRERQREGERQIKTERETQRETPDICVFEPQKEKIKKAELMKKWGEIIPNLLRLKTQN